MKRIRSLSLIIASLCTITLSGCAERLRYWQQASAHGSLDVHATVMYKRGCGYARSGDEAYVVNTVPDRTVKLLVEKWSPYHGYIDYTNVVLGPGESASLGCTFGPDQESPRYQFLIKSCVVVGHSRGYMGEGK